MELLEVEQEAARTCIGRTMFSENDKLLHSYFACYPTFLFLSSSFS